MDFLLDALLDLVLVSSIEGSKSSKVPKPIRIILIAFIIFFFASVIFLIAYVGVATLKDNVIGGTIIILFALLMLILTIYRLKQIYDEKTR